MMKALSLLSLAAVMVTGSKHDPEADITDRVYFDIEIDGAPAGRITLGLYRYQAPMWVSNFLRFCDGSAGVADDGTVLWYKGTELYDMMPDEYILGGDVENNDGTGDNYSIFDGGKEFPDDGAFLPFNRKYLLVAANLEQKENQNSQKFWISIRKNAQYDKKFQRVGEVIDG